MEKEAGRQLPITAWGVDHAPQSWAEYRDAGIERVILSIESEPADVVLPQLDEWAKAVANAKA